MCKKNKPEFCCKPSLQPSLTQGINDFIFLRWFLISNSLCKVIQWEIWIYPENFCASARASFSTPIILYVAARPVWARMLSGAIWIAFYMPKPPPQTARIRRAFPNSRYKEDGPRGWVGLLFGIAEWLLLACMHGWDYWHNSKGQSSNQGWAKQPVPLSNRSVILPFSYIKCTQYVVSIGYGIIHARLFGPVLYLSQ